MSRRKAKNARIPLVFIGYGSVRDRPVAARLQALDKLLGDCYVDAG